MNFDLFLISPIAFGRATPIILILVLSIFILLKRPSDIREILFLLHFLSVFIFNIGYFIAYSVYSPAGNSGWYLSIAAVFSVAIQIQFAYRFPQRFVKKEHHIVLVVSMIICFLSLIDYFFRAQTATVRLNETGYGSVYRSVYVPAGILLLSIWRIIVFLRQTIYCSGYHGKLDSSFSECTNTLKGKLRFNIIKFLISIKKIIKPSGKAARAARSYAILVTFEMLLAIFVVVFITTDIISETNLNIVMNIVLLFIYLGYVIIFFNKSNISFSFIYKIIAISMVVLLSITTTMGMFILFEFEKNYDNSKKT